MWRTAIAFTIAGPPIGLLSWLLIVVAYGFFSSPMREGIFLGALISPVFLAPVAYLIGALPAFIIGLTFAMISKFVNGRWSLTPPMYSILGALIGLLYASVISFTSGLKDLGTLIVVPSIIASAILAYRHAPQYIVFQAQKVWADTVPDH